MKEQREREQLGGRRSVRPAEDGAKRGGREGEEEGEETEKQQCARAKPQPRLQPRGGAVVSLRRREAKKLLAPPQHRASSGSDSAFPTYRFIHTGLHSSRISKIDCAPRLAHSSRRSLS